MINYWKTACAILAICIAPAIGARGQTFTLLWSFHNHADGGNPAAPPIVGNLGNVYGTTVQGGDLMCAKPLGCGTVYRLSSDGKFTVLHQFQGTDGRTPYTTLTTDAQGNGYGTTVGGGTYGYGEVFEINNLTGELTVVYSFHGSPDGAFPEAPLIRDAAGNFYGTTDGGGGFVCPIDNGIPCGTVFKLDTSGNETVLYSFKGGRDGVFPYGGLARDSKGNLYGTTWTGGGNLCGGFGCGTVFGVNPSGEEEVLYRFTGATDGAYPYATLLGFGQGVIGTTQSGGDLSCDPAFGCGTVFELSTSGLSVLHTFLGSPDGASPWQGNVIRDAQGNLYGTTLGGGSFGCGSVYKLDATNNETILYSFTCGSDGTQPTGVTLDSEGNLYGTTQEGGIFGYGTLFKLTLQ